jgi:hypothetical protein
MSEEQHQRPVVPISRQIQAVELLIKHGADGMRRAGVSASQVGLIQADARAAIRSLDWIETHRDAIRAAVGAPGRADREA